MGKSHQDKLHHHLNEAQKNKLRKAVGGLRWMADQTRPDVSFACLSLNCTQTNPTFRDVKLYNNSVQNIKNNDFELVFRKLLPDKWVVSVFSDASYNNLPPDQGPENRRQRFSISFAEAIFEAYFSLDKIRFFFVEQNVKRKKKPSCNKMIDFSI